MTKRFFCYLVFMEILLISIRLKEEIPYDMDNFKCNALYRNFH